MTSPSTYNLADIWECVADACADRIAVVCGQRRLTYAHLEERANRLANHLAGQGIGPGDHVGLYLYNGTEYLEAMLAAYKVRAVPININFRYVAGELKYLLDDSDSVAVLFNARFEETLAEVIGDCPDVRLCLRVPPIPADHDDAVDADDYDTVLAAASPDRRVVDGRSGEDRYVIYTGGTTGLPKGVVWRQEDAFFGCMGGGDPSRLTGPVDAPEQLAERISDDQLISYAIAPLMHAAAQWTSFMWLLSGSRVVLFLGPLDPPQVWQTVEDEKVNLLTVVGDAVGRPLIDEWEANPGRWDASNLFSLANGGAPMSATLRARVAAAFPNAIIADGFGSSETGVQGSERVAASDLASEGGRRPRFAADDKTIVITEDGRKVEPGSGETGKVATTGPIPLGYYNDPEKTAATFVEVGGTRFVIAGDMATVEADGSITLLGRGSVSINTGGEKVFPEEVEGVLHGHPDVYDVTVVGVPDERWGERVTAVVQASPGTTPTLDGLAEHCKTSLAGYKVPKALVLVDKIERSPAGKPDYRWATQVATAP